MSTATRITIQVDAQSANQNLARFASEFKKLSDELRKPIGQIEAFRALKKNLGESEAALKSAQEKAAALAREIRTSVDPPKALTKAFEQAKKEAGALKDAVSKQQIELHRMRQAMKAAGLDTTKLASEQLRLKNSLSQVTAEFKRNQAVASARDALGLKPHQEIRQEIERLKSAYKTLATSGKLSMGELAQAKVVLNQRIRELKDQTNGWAGGMERIKMSLAGLAAGAAAFLLPIREAMRFETAMSGVAKVVDAPKQKIEELGEALLHLTRTLPLTAVELAEIAEAGGQMGIAAQDIESFVVITAKIATAFKMTAEDAGTAIGKLKNLYKLTIPDIEKLADAINTLGNNTNAVERDITRIMVEVGGMAQVFGLTGRQTAALAAALLSLGVPVASVDTTISAMLSKLQAANVGTNEFKQALAELGISADRLAIDIAENPQKALLEFLETLKRLDSKELSEKLVKLFGLEYQKNIATLIQGLDEYKRALGLAENETETAGAVNDEYARGLQTLENQFNLARNAVQELAIQLAFLETAKTVVMFFKDLVNGVTDLARSFPILSQLASMAGIVAASLGALGLAVSGFALVFGKAFEAARMLGSGFLLASQAITGLGGAAAALSGAFTGLLLVLNAFAVDRIHALIKVFGDWLGLQKDIDRMSGAYRKSAREFEQYKDAQLKGFEELKAMSDSQLRNEYENLQKAMSYWVRYRAALETKAQETSWGGLFSTDEAKAAQAEIAGASQQIERLTEAQMRLGRVARESGVELEGFGRKASDAGTGTARAETGARTLVFTLEKAKDAVSDLSRQHDAMVSAISRAYDFAAARAKALATDEKEGAAQVLEIERQKKDTLIGLANEAYWGKLALLQKSLGDEKTKNEEIKTIARDLTATKVKAVEEWLSKLQAAHLQALTDEKRYAAEVKALQRELAGQQLTTEEMIREARRKTMTEEKAWQDKRKEAAETLNAAFEAMSRAQTPEALKDAVSLAEKARQQFSGLAGEVKSGDQVVVSMQKSVATATAGMAEAQRAIDEAMRRQIELADRNRKESEESAKGFYDQWQENRKLLDEMNAMVVKPTTEIQVDSSEVDAKLRELNNTVTHSTHIVHVQTVQESAAGGPVPAFAEGGWNRLRGKLAGYGGGDRIRALLEAGEFIIRKEAVAKYGAGLFHALNAMRLNIAGIVAGAMPRMLEFPRAAYATGGQVTAANYGILRLQAGGVELPVQVPGPRGREAVREFERELRKERLVRGR